MVNDPAWKPVELPILDRLIDSGQTFALPPTSWPPWGQDTTKFQRIWLYAPDSQNRPTSGMTTAIIVGRLLTERVDAKDAPTLYNYNFYLLVQSADGRVYQSGPIRTSDPPHHSAEPVSWLSAYGPPPL